MAVTRVDGADDLAVVLELLDLADAGDDAFVGRHPTRTTFSRTFGGQLVAQSLIAAGRTVTGAGQVHSVQTHFIRGGDNRRDLRLEVMRLRDGRAFANRRVDVTQDGQLVCTSLVAYQEPASGLEHASPAPAVPPPGDLPTLRQVLDGFEDSLAMFADALHPVDMRYANDPAWVQKGTGEARTDNRVWMRSAGELPDDPTVHAAMLAYASDTTVLDSILTTHGLSWGLDRVLAATLNHSLWFHRPVRFDDWHLYATTSPVAASSRGIGRGVFYDADGVARVSVVQEGVVRHYPARRR